MVKFAHHAQPIMPYQSDKSVTFALSSHGFKEFLQCKLLLIEINKKTLNSSINYIAISFYQFNWIEEPIPRICVCIKNQIIMKKLLINEIFLLQPTVDIEIFPTAIGDWSENSAEDITQEDIDKMIVQYPAIRGSSKPVNNPDIIAGISVYLISCMIWVVTWLSICCPRKHETDT